MSTSHDEIEFRGENSMLKEALVTKYVVKTAYQILLGLTRKLLGLTGMWRRD